MPLPKGFVPLAPGPGPDGAVIPADQWNQPGRPMFVAVSLTPLGPGGLIPVWPNATPLDRVPRWVMYGGPFDAAYYQAVRQYLIEGWKARGYWADVRRVPIAFDGTGGVRWPWSDFRWVPWQNETAFPARWRYRQGLGNAVAWESAPAGAEVAGLDVGALTDDVDPTTTENAAQVADYVLKWGQPNVRIGSQADGGTWYFWEEAPKASWWGYGDKQPFTARDQAALVAWGNFTSDSDAPSPPNVPATKAPPYAFAPLPSGPAHPIGQQTLPPPTQGETVILPPMTVKGQPPAPASETKDTGALLLTVAALGALVFHRELGL